MIGQFISGFLSSFLISCFAGLAIFYHKIDSLVKKNFASGMLNVAIIFSQYMGISQQFQ
jgi:hypothetical protein